LPLYHNKDLVNWALLGYALTCKGHFFVTDKKAGH
jgi:hypothetical protein